MTNHQDSISKTSMRLQKWERCQCGHVWGSHGTNGDEACWYHPNCGCMEFNPW